MTITQGLKKGMKKVLESAGGGEKGKPHSTSAGRIAEGARKFRRGAKKVVPGAIEGVKKIARPFVKEAVGLEKLKTDLRKKISYLHGKENKNIEKKFKNTGVMLFTRMSGRKLIQV